MERFALYFKSIALLSFRCLLQFFLKKIVFKTKY